MAIEPIEFSWTDIENIVRMFFPDIAKQIKLPDRNLLSEIFPTPAPTSINHIQSFPPTQDHSNSSGRSPQNKCHAQSLKSQCMRSAEPNYRSYQQRDMRSQTPTQHQTLCNDHSIGLNDQYTRPTLSGTVNNGIYIPVRLRYDNMNRSSAQPNMQSHTNVTTSMVNAFQQQVLLNKALMSMPVFLEEKNSSQPWITTVENAAKFSHQDPIDVAMMKLTSALLQVATYL